MEKGKISIRYGLSVAASLIVVLALLSGTQTQPDSIVTPQIPHLVQEALDKRVNKFRKTILDKCRREAIANAEIYIDSLMANEIKLQSADTLAFPAKPERPSLGKPIVLDDSTRIMPIIRE